MSKFFFENSLNIDGICYGFFTRQGGCSLNNFDSLNCSFSSGDNIDIVNKNINLALKSINLQNKKIKFIKQTHSNNVAIINNNNLNSLITADASITKSKNIVLAILTADCAPVFLFDKESTFICSIHVGWKGCLNNIIKITLEKIKAMDINNKNLIAIIGPCLAQKNFEVDSIFRRNFIQKNSNYKIFFSKKLNQNKYFFNMRNLINFQLQEFLSKSIYNISLDTYKNSDLFFSHRKSTHQNALPTGRMINLIGFND
tara:strand:- start:2503 stop:3273 length:771 start_codon:yes stop_codon:yes gene_type:complete